MNEPETPPAASRNPFRCFDRRFLLESFLVGLAIIGIALASKTQPKGSALRVAAAALESVAFGWIAVRSVLSVRRLDELQQRIHLVAIAISFTVIGVVLVTLDFLAGAGFEWRPEGGELWTGMVLVWWIAVAALNRRYR